MCEEQPRLPTAAKLHELLMGFWFINTRKQLIFRDNICACFDVINIKDTYKLPFSSSYCSKSLLVYRTSVWRTTVSIIMKSFNMKPARRKADIAERLRPQRNKYIGGISEYSEVVGMAVDDNVRVELVTLAIVIFSSNPISMSNGSLIVWLNSITLKTAHAPMSDVVIRNIAKRIDRTDDIIWPGKLLATSDCSDIS